MNDSGVISAGTKTIKDYGLVGLLVMAIIAGAYLLFIQQSSTSAGVIDKQQSSIECLMIDLKSCQAELVSISRESAAANYEMAKAILELKLSIDRFARVVEQKYPVIVQ